MTTEFRTKQPSEKFPISFDFAGKLGAATISSVTSIIALDESTLADVSTTVLDSALQTNTTTVVYTYVRAGTSGHRYIITCIIAGSDGSIYELDGILPVAVDPAVPSSSAGGTHCVVAPTIEPVTLADFKLQIRGDSTSFDDGLGLTQSLAFASHAIADNYTTHVGTGVLVAGKIAEVIMSCGTNGATGTVDTKIQESDDNSIWVDWTGGTFTQVTTANDNTDYKKQYTGTKSYIRTASKVLLAACEFGTSILTNAATTAEDTLLTSIIQSAREMVEDECRRALLTQTWDYCLQEWPSKNYIKLPFGNLQSVSFVKWADTDGTETTLTATTDYLVEYNGERCGRIVLPYGGSWPSGSLYPSNPITIRFVCGWTTAALVPAKIRSAILMICTDLWMNRESQTFSNNSAQKYEINQTMTKLLWNAKLWEEF